MSDLISRQAAIDALNVGAELLRRVLDDTDFVGEERAKFEWGLELIESCISDVKELPPAQQWIPCNERLPEEYGEYLITWETSKAPTRFIGFAEGEETGVWDDQHDRFVFSWLPEDYIIERYPDWRVIAWMPLPEPWKGEDDERA